MPSAREGLAGACREIGSCIDLVQGGGGNISLKIDGKKMLIKSSGIELSKVSARKGITVVDYPLVREALISDSCAKEEDYSAVLNDSVCGEKTQKPSIEAGMHSLLGKAVVHTHPVGVNSLLCAANAEKHLHTAIREPFVFIPYASPGICLSKAFGKIGSKSGCGIFFLENHGLVVSAPLLGKAVEKTKSIEKKIISYLERLGVNVFIPSKIFVKWISKGDFCLEGAVPPKEKCLESFVFPDSIVYCGNGFSIGRGIKGSSVVFSGNNIQVRGENPVKIRRALEAALAHMCIMGNIMQFGKPKCLGAKEILELRGMSCEKARRDCGSI